MVRFIKVGMRCAGIKFRIPSFRHPCTLLNVNIPAPKEVRLQSFLTHRRTGMLLRTICDNYHGAKTVVIERRMSTRH